MQKNINQNKGLTCSAILTITMSHSDVTKLGHFLKKTNKKKTANIYKSRMFQDQEVAISEGKKRETLLYTVGLPVICQ